MTLRRIAGLKIKARPRTRLGALWPSGLHFFDRLSDRQAILICKAVPYLYSSRAVARAMVLFHDARILLLLDNFFSSRSDAFVGIAVQKGAFYARALCISLRPLKHVPQHHPLRVSAQGFSYQAILSRPHFHIVGVHHIALVVDLTAINMNRRPYPMGNYEENEGATKDGWLVVISVPIPCRRKQNSN